MLRVEKIKLTIGLALGVLCLVPAAFAQTTGGVKGKVRTARGDAIASVSISARQNAKDIRTVTSNSKGEFVLNGLEPGVYNFVFDAPGYSSGLSSNIEVRANKTTDLGDRLILLVDRGTLVIVQGSVFYKSGTSVPGAKVVVEKVNSDGTTRDLTTVYTNVYGEFVFKQPQGAAKFKITAKYKDSSASKEIEVGSAAIYRLAISLNISRENK